MPVTDIYTLRRYLKSLVNLPVSDDAITGICLKRGIGADEEFTALEERDYELACADMYAYLATSPINSQKISDSDADWSHSEGGQMLSTSQLAYYRSLANAIYGKYGEPLVSTHNGQWGMAGYGFGKGTSRGRDK